MPSYKVEYTVERTYAPLEPTGAKNFKATPVKVLPAKIEGRHTFGHKYLKVTTNSCGRNGAVIETPDGEDICLTSDSVDKLIEALQEARKGG